MTFYHGSPINIIKHGFITFDMVNICVQKKILKFCDIFKNLKIVMHAKISCFTAEMCENMFFYSSKSGENLTAMRNNEFNSRSLRVN